MKQELLQKKPEAGVNFTNASAELALEELRRRLQGLGCAGLYSPAVCGGVSVPHIADCTLVATSEGKTNKFINARHVDTASNLVE